MESRRRRQLSTVWSAVLSIVLPVAALTGLLVGLVAAAQLLAGSDALTASVVVAAAAACGLLAAVVLPSGAPTAVLVTAPAFDRLRGRFSQQSRPGVPGRVRPRAPGR